MQTLKFGNRKSAVFALSFIGALLLPVANAQEPKVINIWPGVAPGSEQWKQRETMLGSGAMQRIVNVTTPTLTAYLPDPAKATGTAVIIAPGGGFIFLGTEGTGYHQERGKPIRIVHKGDVIKCPPGVEHWHGASPGSGFAYIAVTPVQKGKTVWLEPVSDEVYKSVK